jgi:hypothetical protein
MQNAEYELKIPNACRWEFSGYLATKAAQIPGNQIPIACWSSGGDARRPASGGDLGGLITSVLGLLPEPPKGKPWGSKTSSLPRAMLRLPWADLSLPPSGRQKVNGVMFSKRIGAA